MDAQSLKEIFERPYNRADWYAIGKEIFNADKLLAKPVPIKLPENEWEAQGFELGSFETIDGRLIGLYQLEIGKKAQLHRNRKGLKDLLAKVYKEAVDAALIVFVQGTKWRFSYVSEIYTYNNITGKREKKATDPKRFTYLLGEGERCKTAADRFARIQQTGNLFAKGVTLEALEDAFNVDKMSKAFFNEYRKHYGAFTAFLTGKDEAGKEVRKSHASLRSVFNGDEKDARDFVKKLLGRIVFLYFLQKKGWLGVPEDKSWGHGNEDFLHQLFKDYKDDEGFYALVLVPLFFETLNTERDNDLFKIKSSLFNKAGYNKVKIPYLNGGLFDDDQPETDMLEFPKELFEKLFLFFDQYNFTVYEDSPDEHTVAVDPEMLGHIFENLLEDNKDKGAYYTPKEIVHYMCRESLIEFLYTKLNTEEDAEQVKRNAIEKFIKNHEAADIIDWDENILAALKDLKVCDPAIGSGAFPMGILMEIFYAVETLFYANPDTVNAIWKLGNNNQVFNAAKVKESIIQNSIYGVDIEKGAVDIARLRFWLSLVVDEAKPKPLPNLDYKIVVGNSLLSKFEEEVINIDWDINSARGTEATRLIITQQAGKLHTLQAWQTAYFYEKWDKTKQQLEIRNIKIDILINQLTLSKISFQHNNPKLGGFAPTAKEIQKNLENELGVAGYDNYIKKLEVLKKDKNSALEFFDWKLDFPEVMNETVKKGEVGFDIVIGNPPYLEARSSAFTDKTKEEIQESIRKRIGEKVKYFTKGSDLLIYFFEIGIHCIHSKGQVVFITQNSWLDTEFGRKFQQFLLNNTCVKTIYDSDYKYFNEKSGPNINTVISIFQGKTSKQVNEIRFSRFHKNFQSIPFGMERLQSKDAADFVTTKIYNYGDSILANLKWGILLSSTEETIDLVKLVQKEGLYLDKLEGFDISIGQGLNLSKEFIINQASINHHFLKKAQINFFTNDDGAPFKLSKTVNFLIDTSRLQEKELKELKKNGIKFLPEKMLEKLRPILILPRGVGRHFCAINECDAFTSSYVDVYDNLGNTTTELKLNLWLFLNSSICWLLREISGRKNLGGGMLKAEAIDLKTFPIYFEFKEIEKIQAIYKNISSREARDIESELNSEEHIAIDEIVCNHLNISQEMKSRYRELLVKSVKGRSNRSKT